MFSTANPRRVAGAQGRFVAAILTCLVSVLVMSCASRPLDAPNGSSSEAPASPQTLAWQSAYELRPGDVIQFTVHDEPDLSSAHTIDDKGFINLPLVGQLEAAGYTTDSVQNRAARKLSQGYLVRPKVSVTLESLPPVYVSGMVRKPGAYPFELGLTAGRAVILAGGATALDGGKYYLTRKPPFRHKNPEPERTIRVTADTAVLPGDVLRVLLQPPQSP